MITIIILGLIFAGIICTVVMYLITRVVDDRAARIAFFITGAASPFLLLVALFRTYVMRRPPHVHPCPEFLANIEREIETERIGIYGGHRLQPSLSESWQVAYLQSLERTAAKVGSVFSALNNKDHAVVHI